MARLDLIRELASFFLSRKKYFLAPFLVALVLMALFVLIAEIPVLTPFIYALF